MFGLVYMNTPQSSEMWDLLRLLSIKINSLTSASESSRHCNNQAATGLNWNSRVVINYYLHVMLMAWYIWMIKKDVTCIFLSVAFFEQNGCISLKCTILNKFICKSTSLMKTSRVFLYHHATYKCCLLNIMINYLYSLFNAVRKNKSLYCVIICTRWGYLGWILDSSK